MKDEDHILSPDPITREEFLDRALRPQNLDEYIGQDRVCEQMQLFITAARGRREPIDHCLLFGPPGLGKTTLARIIATEMASELTSTSGPVLEKTGDLAALLTNLKPGDVLFIDEIHRLLPVVEELLYSAMEDFRLDIIIGEGPAARTVRLDLAPFTLVGATTRAGLLTAPLRARFGILQRLEFYKAEEMARIVTQSAKKMGVSIDPEGGWEIARRSRGTPRIANRLLRRARDYAEVHGNGSISQEVANATLQLLRVDASGLDELDRDLLHILIERFEGGPVGIDSLATAFGEEKGTIEDMIEPFLIQQGFLVRTPRGRVASKLAYEHMNLPEPAGRPQMELSLGEEDL